jgi:hypothetical protein
MPQRLVPARFNSPLIFLAGLKRDRLARQHEPPLLNSTEPTVVNRLLVLFCRKIPWNVSVPPFVGAVPLQFAAVLQYL